MQPDFTKIKHPYRLQIFLPDDVRQALREVTRFEHDSQQQIVLRWLREQLAKHPATPRWVLRHWANRTP